MREANQKPLPLEREASSSCERGRVFALLLLSGFLWIPCSTALYAQSAIGQTPPSQGILPVAPAMEAQVIRMADEAEYNRESKLAGYTVTEHYLITNSRFGSPEDAIVHVTYNAGSGKVYQVVSRSGPYFLNKILNSMLASETKLSGGPTRTSALVTSANYSMKLIGQQSIGDRLCYLLEITPREVNEYTLKGRIWVDQPTGLLVRIEGAPGASPSFLAGNPTLARDYAAQGGFALATHSHATSSGFLAGQTTIDIDYTDYTILPSRQP